MLYMCIYITYIYIYLLLYYIAFSSACWYWWLGGRVIQHMSTMLIPNIFCIIIMRIWHLMWHHYRSMPCPSTVFEPPNLIHPHHPLIHQGFLANSPCQQAVGWTLESSLRRTVPVAHIHPLLVVCQARRFFSSPKRDWQSIHEPPDIQDILDIQDMGYVFAASEGDGQRTCDTAALAKRQQSAGRVYNWRTGQWNHPAAYFFSKMCRCNKSARACQLTLGLRRGKDSICVWSPFNLKYLWFRPTKKRGQECKSHTQCSGGSRGLWFWSPRRTCTVIGWCPKFCNLLPHLYITSWWAGDQAAYSPLRSEALRLVHWFVTDRRVVPLPPRKLRLQGEDATSFAAAVKALARLPIGLSEVQSISWKPWNTHITVLVQKRSTMINGINGLNLDQFGRSAHGSKPHRFDSANALPALAGQSCRPSASRAWFGPWSPAARYIHASWRPPCKSWRSATQSCSRRSCNDCWMAWPRCDPGSSG